MIDGRYRHTDAPRVGVCIPRAPAVHWRRVYSGIRDRAEQFERDGVPVRLIMRHDPLTPDAEQQRDFMAWLGEKDPQGLILFPVGKASFLKQVALSRHVVLLGARNSDLMGCCGYIGTDPDVEGRLAAEMLMTHRPALRTVAILRQANGYYDFTSSGRRWGLCDYLVRQAPQVDIFDAFVDLHSRVSAAMIARALTEEYGTRPLDAVYCAEGHVEAACQGVAKARRGFADPAAFAPFAHTLCLGHELPRSAESYRQAGLLAGCVAQDAYATGVRALEQAVDRCLGRRQAPSWELIPSQPQWLLEG